jgi:hypothetical protein
VPCLAEAGRLLVEQGRRFEDVLDAAVRRHLGTCMV